MKAIVYDRYGSPADLRLETVEKPVPQDDEILIKIQAASLNRSDWEMLRGKPLYACLGGLRKPRRRTLGSDIAGRVEAVGKYYQPFQPGDEVFGDIMGRMGYPLHAVPEALQYLGDGGSKGKVIITVASELGRSVPDEESR